MVSWKRRFADFVAKRLNLTFARAGNAWELMEPEQLKRFLTAFRVDCVFDVGANIGQYGERLRSIGYTGLILSFEPNPDAVEALRATVGGDVDWIVEEVALDETSRCLTFNVMRSPQFSSLHDPDHSSTESFVDVNCVERKIEVQTETLENLFPLLQARFSFRRPFLKMDTQGHDVAVAKGAGQYLKQFVGLQSELSLTSLYKGQVNYQEALDFYKNSGFRLSALVPNNAGHFPDLNETDCIMYNPDFYSGCARITDRLRHL